MRTFLKIINDKTFTPTLIVLENKKKQEYELLTENDYSDFTSAQQLKIFDFNETLISNNQNVVTIEEAEHYFYPLGRKEPTVEELQRLAGFSVEKKITYFNDMKDKKDKNASE